MTALPLSESVPSDKESWGTFWIRSVRESTFSIRVISVSLAALIALAQFTGQRIERYGSLGFTGRMDLLIYLVKILVTTVAIMCVLFPVFRFSVTWPGKTPGTPRGIWGLPTGRRRTAVIGILAAVFLCYWLFLWPGITSVDSYAQIQQALGNRTYSDHHPIFMTLVIQLILRPAVALTGTITAGIAIVVLIQLLIFAAILGFCIDLLSELSIPNWVQTATLAFFALNPIVGWYSVTLWKDVWLAAFTLLLGTLSVIFVRRNRSGVNISWKWWAIFAVAAMGVMISKKTGIFLVAPLLFSTWFFVRGIRIRWASVGVGSIVVYLLLHAGVMSILEVKPGSSAEAFSLPSQQMARVVRDHGDELTANDLAELAFFYPGKNLGEIYKPILADPIKDSLSVAALSQDKGGYLALWARLGSAFPRTYADAFLAGTSGYWYPGTKEWLVSSVDWTMIANKTQLGDGIPQEIDPNLSSDRVVYLQNRLTVQETVNLQLRNVPVVGLFLSLGAWTWASAVLTAIALVRRRPEAVPVITLQWMVWLTCMISPVYAEARYAFPMLLMLPLLAVAAFQTKQTTKASHDHDKPE